MTKMLRRVATGVALVLVFSTAAVGDTVDDRYRDGLRHYVDGDYEAAVDSLKKAYARKARVDVRVALARASLKLGRCEELKPLVSGIDLSELRPEQRRFARSFVAEALERCDFSESAELPPERPEAPAKPRPEIVPRPALVPPPRKPMPAPIAQVAPPADRDGMVPLEGDRFRMGSRSGARDEKPVRSVSVSAFWIDSHEVTAADFAACVDRGDCPRSGFLSASQNEACNIGSPARREHPANCVSWGGAQKYCQAQGKRLPTEIEWEFAARGNKGRVHPWGDEAPDCARCGIGGWACGMGTVPVKSRPDGATPEGVAGLCGNVMEWVADWYDARAYRKAAKRAPSGPEGGTERVVRGAVRQTKHWVSTASPDSLEATVRASQKPEAMVPTLGFRCARGEEGR